MAEAKKNLFDNIWELHTIEQNDSSSSWLSIDRCYIHDLNSPYVFKLVDNSGLNVWEKQRVLGIPDHSLSSRPGRTGEDTKASKTFMSNLRSKCTQYGVDFFEPNSPEQGIVHVVGPDLGLSLPGMTIVCGDSHTCTHGAIGALAWGIGTSEHYHVLCTQTLNVKKPKSMRISVEGTLGEDVGPMDIILFIIAKYGADFANGYAVEFSGSVIHAMDMDGRMTICNLCVELGTEYGLISPDEKTFAYLASRKYAPSGEMFEQMVSHCKEIASTPESVFDKEIAVDVTGLDRQVSWGISPAHTIGIHGVVPDLSQALSEKDRKGFAEAYAYMDFKANDAIAGVAVDRVFIGSCSNGRLSNIKLVAELVKGKKVAEHVEAWIVPGSQQVKKDAEALGLDTILKEAGFLWGEPGCALCSGSNGESIPAGKRCVSTTNRNFIGRQGKGARTHLSSPYTAALAAICGKIV